jgi:hypothetical protein
VDHPVDVLLRHRGVKQREFYDAPAGQEQAPSVQF